MAPTLSASGSVGEGRVEGSGGERRGCGRMPLSRGECGRHGQQERERQGLLRPSGPRFLQCALLKTDTMTLTGQLADVSSAFSAMLNK